MQNSSPTQQILFIDDEPIHIKLLEHRFKQENFEINHCLDVDSGLSWLEKNPAALTFLDIVLPGIDGISACQDVVAANRNHGGGVIVHTSLHLDERTSTQLYEIGALEILHKPVLLETTFAKILSLLHYGQKSWGKN